MIDPEHKQTHEEFRAAEVENNGTLPLDGVPIHDEAEKRRILRKIDWRVVPSLAVMYLVSFVDRSNSKTQKDYSKDVERWFRILSWKC